MRALILAGLSALALGACNGEPTAEERAAAERNVTTQVVATNDTTAIDAATGEAANMAADVDFMPELDNQAEGNDSTPAAARPRQRQSATTPRPAPEPAPAGDDDGDQPDTNSL